MEGKKKTLTTIAFESSWWASSSLTAIFEILWERTFWRVVQSAFLQMLLGISLKPKPRRNAPVTSPKVFEQAMAKPRTSRFLLIQASTNKKWEHSSAVPLRNELKMHIYNNRASWLDSHACHILNIYIYIPGGRVG